MSCVKQPANPTTMSKFVKIFLTGWFAGLVVGGLIVGFSLHTSDKPKEDKTVQSKLDKRFDHLDQLIMSAMMADQCKIITEGTCQFSGVLIFDRRTNTSICICEKTLSKTIRDAIASSKPEEHTHEQ